MRETGRVKDVSAGAVIIDVVYDNDVIADATAVTVTTNKAARSLSLKTPTGVIVEGTWTGDNPYTFTPDDASIFSADFLIVVT